MSSSLDPRRFVAWLALIALIAVACASTPEPLVANAGRHTVFLRKLGRAVSGQNSDAINWLRVLREVPNDVTRTDLVRRFEGGLGPLSSLADRRRAGEFVSGGRVTRRNGRDVVRVAHVAADGRVTLYDFRVGRDGRATDVFDLSRGLWLSTYFCTAYLYVHSVESLESAESDIVRLREHLTAGEWSSAIEVHSTLPEPGRAAALGYLFHAAERSDDRTFLTVVRANLERYPERADVHLYALSAFWRSGDVAAARRSLAVLSNTMPDPVWLIWEARLAFDTGASAAALEYVDAVVVAEPGVQVAHELGLIICLKEGDAACANRHLRILIDQFHQDPGDLTGDDFEGVRELEAFREQLAPTSRFPIP